MKIEQCAEIDTGDGVPFNIKIGWSNVPGSRLSAPAVPRFVSPRHS